MVGPSANKAKMKVRVKNKNEIATTPIINQELKKFEWTMKH